MTKIPAKELNTPEMASSLLITAAAALLGAAACSKIADDLVGSRGFPAALAQIGGAILGGYGGKGLVDYFREQERG